MALASQLVSLLLPMTPILKTATGMILLKEDFSTSAQLTFWTGWFSPLKGCSVHCRMGSSNPGRFPLHASSTLPSCYNQKCLQCPGWGMGVSFPIQNYCFYNISWTFALSWKLSTWFPSLSVLKQSYFACLPGLTRLPVTSWSCFPQISSPRYLFFACYGLDICAPPTALALASSYVEALTPGVYLEMEPLGLVGGLMTGLESS